MPSGHSNWLPAPNHAREELGVEHFENLSIESRLLHSRLKPLDPNVDPLTTPIYHSSVYRNKSVQQFTDFVTKPHGSNNYIYQRLGHPTALSAELLINELEEGSGTLLFNSGLSACTNVLLCFLKAGDHIIVQRPIYSGVQHFIANTIGGFGVEIDWVRADSGAEAYSKLVKPTTRMIYVETPCNPLMTITDLEGIGELSGKGNQLMTVVDSTFASPLIQKPIKFGVDVVVHSCSKYLGGHTDLIAGCATFKDTIHWQRMKSFQQTCGSYLSAFDASLLIRGIKTLPLRMERHCSTAMKVAEFLASHKKVVAVHYPGLPSHPDHELAGRQMSQFGGMISFDMPDFESAKRVVEGIRLIVLAVSLGGTESLMEHPASMTHGPLLMSAEARRESMISDGLIRLSVGLEGADDLIQDLRQALDKA